MKILSLLIFFSSFALAKTDYTQLKSNLSDVITKYKINSHINGAAVLIVHRNEGEIFYRDFGLQGSEGSRKIQRDTIFDLASMTKLYTAAGVLLLHQQRQLDIDDKMNVYFSEFSREDKKDVSVAHILGHESGVAAVNYLRDFVEGDLEQTWNNILNIKMVGIPSKRFVYSDVGYLLLGRLIESRSEMSLNSYIKKHIFEKLNLQNSFYKVPTTEKYKVVRTDLNKPIAEVHDPRSAKLNGNAGHAGIFATIDDVFKFSQIYWNDSFFTEETKSRLLKPNKFGRALGPDVSSKYSSSVRGIHLPIGKSFGHTGYTGTSLWMDKKSGVTIIILSNRVFPNDSNDSKRAISALRREIANTIGLHFYPSQELPL